MRHNCERVSASKGSAKSLKTCSVDVEPTAGGEIKAGFPATGTALTVKYSDDPVGFEIYTWTERIQIVTAEAKQMLLPLALPRLARDRRDVQKAM
jgi:hypothetical protein